MPTKTPTPVRKKKKKTPKCPHYIYTEDIYIGQRLYRVTYCNWCLRKPMMKLI